MGDTTPPTTCTTQQQNKLNGLVFNIPGTRYTPVNPYSFGYTQQQLDMRRKAEILQYNKTSNGKATQKQKWATLVRGSTQRKQYSSYYIRALQEGNLRPEEICPNDIKIPTLTTKSDVPGPPMLLYYDPTVPLYNYNSVQFAYGTQNTDNRNQPFWVTNYDTDVVDNNSQKIFTLNIRPSIDNAFYTYTFTTSIGILVSGFTYQSGSILLSIPVENISLVVKFGGQPVTLASAPVITYSPHFVEEISGNIVSPPTSFEGKIYMGEMTFSNILLNTPANATYEFYLNYVPSYLAGDIDSVSVSIITNFKNDYVKKEESQIVFSKPASTDSIGVFSLRGQY
jgi:hypothetical protein